MTARIEAMSSRAICDGPSEPISTPAWEPASRIDSCEIPDIRRKSKARDMKAPKVAAYGT